MVAVPTCNRPRALARRALGAAVLAWALIAVSAGSGCSDRPHAAEASAGWQSLPAAPIGRPGNFSNLAAVRTGLDVVVVAGASGAQSRVQALAFDLRDRAWRRLPSPRLRWRAGLSVVSGAPGVVVWGGANDRGAVADGALIAPSRRNRWRRIPRGPLSPRGFHVAAWAGDRMLVFGGLRDGRRLGDGAVFRPSSGKWRKLPPSPLSPRSHAVAVWTGREVLVWGGAAALGDGGRKTRFVADGAAFDPVSRRWRRIDDGPIRSNESTEGVWTGRSLLVWNGREGASYTPGVDEWRKLPRAPLRPRRHFAMAWSEGRLFVWGGSARNCGDCYLGDGAAYTLGSNRWAPLEAGPAAPRDRHVAVAVRNGFLVWGGCCDRSRYLDDGAAYRAR